MLTKLPFNRQMMNKPDLSEARDYLQTYADKALVAIGSMPMQQRFATGYADTAHVRRKHGKVQDVSR